MGKREKKESREVEEKKQWNGKREDEDGSPDQVGG